MPVQQLSAGDTTVSNLPALPIVGKAGMLPSNQIANLGALTINTTNVTVLAMLGALVAFALMPEKSSQTRKALMILVGVAVGAALGTMMKTTFTLGDK